MRYSIIANTYLLLKKGIYRFCDMSSTIDRLEKPQLWYDTSHNLSTNKDAPLKSSWGYDWYLEPSKNNY